MHEGMDMWRQRRQVPVADLVRLMAHNHRFKPGCEQAGNLGIVPIDFLFGPGVFSPGQDRAAGSRGSVLTWHTTP
jgi:hypothetical protein